MMPMTMLMLAMFSQVVFTYPPMVFLLFSRRIRNTRAAGSRVTAITCTNSVISTSGALGISTTSPGHQENEE